MATYFLLSVFGILLMFSDTSEAQSYPGQRTTIQRTEVQRTGFGEQVVQRQTDIINEPTGTMSKTTTVVEKTGYGNSYGNGYGTNYGSNYGTGYGTGYGSNY